MKRALLAVVMSGSLTSLAIASPPGSHSSSKKRVAKPTLVPRDATQPMAPGELRDDPTRQEILVAIDHIKPKIDECYERLKLSAPATVIVKMVVMASGRVSSATIEGELANTPTAQCVQDAAKAAVFHPFRREKIDLSYPFVLRADPAEAK